DPLGPPYTVEGLVFNPSSCRVASIGVSRGDEEVLKLLDLRTKKVVKELNLGSSKKNSDGSDIPIAVSPNGDLIVFSIRYWFQDIDGDKFAYTIRLLHGTDFDEQKTLHGHTCAVRDIRFSPDGKMFASISRRDPESREGSGEAILWDVASRDKTVVRK